MAAFKKETILALLQINSGDEKTKFGAASIVLSAELLRIFVTEAAIRSAKCASADASIDVMVEHFEKILSQLLLDF